MRSAQLDGVTLLFHFHVFLQSLVIVSRTIQEIVAIVSIVVIVIIIIVVVLIVVVVVVIVSDLF